MADTSGRGSQGWPPSNEKRPTTWSKYSAGRPSTRGNQARRIFNGTNVQLTFLRSQAVTNPLSSEMLRKMNAYWRAANYLSVGQIYLFDNPLLKEPLQAGHVKPRLLGHWGTTP